jgi:DNA-directed RNA polymerase subunit E'/Rpb7
MSKLYRERHFEENVEIKPKELKVSGITSSVDFLNDVIQDKIAGKLEGKCNKHGFIKPESVKLIDRGSGTIRDGHFTGNYVFRVTYSCQVCNPLENLKIDCHVYKKTKMGILAHIGQNRMDSPLLIIIPRQHHIDHPDFDDLEEEDQITVVIKKVRFNLNDTHIRVIGMLIGKNKNSSRSKSNKSTSSQSGGGDDGDIIGLNYNEVMEKENEKKLLNVIMTHINQKKKYDDAKNKDVVQFIQDFKEKYQGNWVKLTYDQKRDLSLNEIRNFNVTEHIKTVIDDWSELVSSKQQSLLKKYRLDYDNTLDNEPINTSEIISNMAGQLGGDFDSDFDDEDDEDDTNEKKDGLESDNDDSSLGSILSDSDAESQNNDNFNDDITDSEDDENLLSGDDGDGDTNANADGDGDDSDGDSEASDYD